MALRKDGSLTVVGTGMLIAGQVTQEALSAMEAAEKLYFLVTDIVTSRWLGQLNPSAESLYGCYADGKPRAETYAEMVSLILGPLREGRRVVAAFYGHPGIFVAPSHEAIRQAKAEGFSAQMLPGISAEDCLFADLAIDPGERGCQSFEATDFLLRRRLFDPTSALVLWQVGGIGVFDFHSRALWSRQGLAVLATRAPPPLSCRSRSRDLRGGPLPDAAAEDPSRAASGDGPCRSRHPLHALRPAAPRSRERSTMRTALGMPAAPR